MANQERDPSTWKWSGNLFGDDEDDSSEDVSNVDEDSSEPEITKTVNPNLIPTSRFFKRRK